MKYCAYVLIDDSDNVRYVGQGTERRLSDVKHSSRSTEFQQILGSGGKLVVVSKFQSKKESLTEEKRLISYYLSIGCKLINKNSGSKQISIKYENIYNYLEYDETSPTFLRWSYDKIKTNGRLCSKARKGYVAGDSGDRRGNIIIDGISYLKSRIIYSLYNRCDVCPDMVVNHKDGNYLNNKFDNLELVTQVENIRKITKPKSNNTGIRGIRLVKSKFGIETYIVSVNNPEGKQIYNSFSCKKYGKESSLDLAKSWRLEKLKLFYPEYYQKML